LFLHVAGRDESGGGRGNGTTGNGRVLVCKKGRFPLPVYGLFDWVKFSLSVKIEGLLKQTDLQPATYFFDYTKQIFRL
jgi:hypothetical protein